jgi:hypothetical protein
MPMKIFFIERENRRFITGSYPFFAIRILGFYIKKNRHPSAINQTDNAI